MPFKIDANTLTNQPARVQVNYPPANSRRLADGGRVVVVAGSKRTVRVTWGVDGTRQATIEELRTLRTASVVSLTFDDADGSETTIGEVYFPEIGIDTPPGGDAAPTRFSNPITLEFLEL